MQLTREAAIGALSEADGAYNDDSGVCVSVGPSKGDADLFVELEDGEGGTARFLVYVVIDTPCKRGLFDGVGNIVCARTQADPPCQGH